MSVRAAIAELRTADRLEAHLDRRGAPLTLVVTIVDALGPPSAAAAGE